MGYQLGIDLGTTYTSAAVCRSPGQVWAEPEVVTLGTRSSIVPSVLFVAPEGSVVVGDAAERRALTDPDRVIREFKRRIGDPTPILVAGRAWAPEELSALLVRWVVDRVAEREGGPADRIAVTHPASWGTHKKDLLAEALADHGLTVTFLAEPQAAALHYAAAERIPAGSAIAVYDLGGGTFDAAVVRKGDLSADAAGVGFGLLGHPEGIERLGGIDFDDAVFEHVRSGLPAAFPADLDDTDPAVLAAVARVRRECTEAKEALSSDTDVSIPVLMPASRGSVRLHRSEFEAMIRPHIEDTVAALRRAVASAGLIPEELTAVLLVGGSSRIPLVGQLVSEQLGRPVAVDADPKNAIAKGAALAVSPKPTASWPGVVIPPVTGTTEVVEHWTPAGAAVFPPVRPPLPALTPAGASSQSGRFAGYPAASHEPATSLLSGSPAPSAAPQAEWIHREPVPEQRQVGLLVGIGGLLAAAAVGAAVMLWPTPPSSAEIGTNNRPSDAVATSEPEPGPDSPVVPPPDTGAPREDAGGNGGSGSGGSAGNGNNAPGSGGGPVRAPARPSAGGSAPTTTAVVDPPLGGPTSEPPPAQTTTDPPPSSSTGGGQTTTPGTGGPVAPPVGGGSTSPPAGGTPGETPAGGGGTTPPGSGTPADAGGGTPPAGGQPASGTGAAGPTGSGAAAPSVQSAQPQTAASPTV
ncbi:Hsp70 family protein [Pseudonocardia xinjiangensis]